MSMKNRLIFEKTEDSPRSDCRTVRIGMSQYRELEKISGLTGLSIQGVIAKMIKFSIDHTVVAGE